MMVLDENSTYGIRARHLAKLLGLAAAETPAEPAPAEDDALRADVLTSCLASALPMDPEVAATLPRILGRLCQDLLPLGGRSLGQVLQDPTADVEALEEIKRYAKRAAAAERGGVDTDAALAVYYAAIAAALLHHGRRITQHSHQKLAAAFAELAQKPWLTTWLATMFQQAGAHCSGERG